jgi:hypothetical protein
MFAKDKYPKQNIRGRIHNTYTLARYGRTMFVHLRARRNLTGIDTLYFYIFNVEESKFCKIDASDHCQKIFTCVFLSSY